LFIYQYFANKPSMELLGDIPKKFPEKEKADEQKEFG
jgi:hypothetical protein